MGKTEPTFGGITMTNPIRPKGKRKVDKTPDVDTFEKSVVDGVGKDAEVVVNSKGGMQSKAIGSFYLIDPDFMWLALKNDEPRAILNYLTDDLLKADKRDVLIEKLSGLYPDMLERIAKVMEYGANKYEPNNWRLIPQEEHINHALIHLYALDRGDTQDNHLDHALARIMMACSTHPETLTSYTEYMG